MDAYGNQENTTLSDTRGSIRTLLIIVCLIAIGAVAILVILPERPYILRTMEIPCPEVPAKADKEGTIHSEDYIEKYHPFLLPCKKKIMETLKPDFNKEHLAFACGGIIIQAKRDTDFAPEILKIVVDQSPQYSDTLSVVVMRNHCYGMKFCAGSP